MKDFKDPFDKRVEKLQADVKKNRSEMADHLAALIEGGVLNPEMSLTEVIHILKDQD